MVKSNSNACVYSRILVPLMIGCLLLFDKLSSAFGSNNHYSYGALSKDLGRHGGLNDRTYSNNKRHSVRYISSDRRTTVFQPQQQSQLDRRACSCAAPTVSGVEDSSNDGNSNHQPKNNPKTWITSLLFDDRIRNGAQKSPARLKSIGKKAFGILRSPIHHIKGIVTSQKDASNPNAVVKTVSPTVIRTTRNSKYNLIWSSGFIVKFILSTILFFGVHEFLTTELRNRNLVIDWNAITIMLPSNTILGIQISLPLLASSCCLIQLAVNLIAGGCVGFNAFLGPIRPFFVSLLLYLTVIRFNNTRLQTHLIRWIISLSPEIVSIYNTLTTARISYSELQPSPIPSTTLIKGGDSATLVGGGGEAISNDVTYNKVTAKFTIPTMGCVACINKINSAIRSVTSGSDRIIQSSSQLNENDSKGGEAIVEFICVSDTEHDTIIQEIQESISNAGFGKNLSLQSSTYRATTHKPQHHEQQQQQQ